MNYLAWSGVLIAVSSLLCSLFVFLSRPFNTLKFIWGLFSLAVGLWGVGLYKSYTATDYSLALFWLRFLNISAITIPIFFLHFAFLFTRSFRRKIQELIVYYFIVFVFVFLTIYFPHEFIPSLSPKAGFQYYPNPGFLYYVFPVIFAFYSVYGVLLLINFMKSAAPILAAQTKYILLGTIIGFLGGSTTFFYVFNIPVYPFGVGFVLFYVFMITYSIIRYRFMEIKVVVTRATIFLLIYSLILGFPIWFGFKILGDGLWVIPIALMGILATLGPFIYSYIQKRAENVILQEQRSYQATLRQASAGMGRIKDLNKLLNMIVIILTRTVKIEHAAIYIYDEINKNYIIGASKKRASKALFPNSLHDSVIVEYLNKNRSALIAEEVKQKAEDFDDNDLRSLESALFKISAALVVPIYIDDRLISFVSMGRKESGKLYTEDDLSVFTILSNQVALAIENSKFYDEMKITQEQLFQAEKMATIGIMADGLSHQINNRFHAMGFISGDALDTIKLNKNAEMSDKMKEVILELERALTRIQENVTQGGEVVQGLLKYTRKGEEGLSPVDVDAVISSSYEMAQFKIKSYQMSLIRDYDKTLLPKVKGNSTQLQEVFFNLIDNAYDAMMQRKNDLKEPEYHPKLTIHARSKGKILEMIFEDNGIGVKEEDVQKLFTPFFTTKLSSKKGTGLGLYVIRKIIEDNHKGKVEFSSQYMTGTQMKIYLPVFTD